MANNKWDERFMQLAAVVASWSKDPSTRVGAVITKGNRIVSLGYNGFAVGVDDSKERYADRDFKYPAVIHAEENCLLFAKQDLTGCTIYVHPMPPCASCAAKIIQVGIKRVVSTAPTELQQSRWGRDIAIANTMFAEAKVSVCQLPQRSSTQCTLNNLAAPTAEPPESPRRS